ncbi:MAG: 50S ribosomal protein L32 [Planctomycetota bacterium]|nr:50S ribosomal protein L32 [Planctomycetota bacterium]MDA1105931.1 50S ribosomal protein L32 [Planctomycetota bacterium]
MQPTHRVSKGRKGRRRAHHALSPVQTTQCPNCGSARRPHAACASCGYLRPGLQVKVVRGERAA